jgi:hypothetical protein
VPVELPEGVNNKAISEADADYSVSTTSGTNVSSQQFSNFPTQRTVQSLTVLSPTVSSDGRKDGGKTKVKVSEEKAPSNKNGFLIDGVDKSEGAGKTADVKLTPEQQKQQEMLAKLHPSVVAVISRLLSKGTQPTADELKFVHDGKAEVQVWLFDKTPEALDELKKLGFEVVLNPMTSKLVIGRIAIEKLSALAELKSVRYVAPQTKRN